MLGTKDTHTYVRESGGKIINLSVYSSYDVLIVGDESGYEFLRTLSFLLSSLFRLYEKGRPPRLLLPNPDIIYPASSDTYGVAAGSIALVIERALEERFSG